MRGGSAVAKRAVIDLHGGISACIGQQARYRADDSLGRAANANNGAGIDRFAALSRFAKRDHRSLERWCFLLHAPRIADDQLRAIHEPHELGIGQRRHQPKIADAREAAVDDVLRRVPEVLSAGQLPRAAPVDPGSGRGNEPWP